LRLIGQKTWLRARHQLILRTTNVAKAVFEAGLLEILAAPWARGHPASIDEVQIVENKAATRTAAATIDAKPAPAEHRALIA
jgi:hypothetical protein